MVARACLVEAMRVPRVPTFFCGDFNTVHPLGIPVGGVAHVDGGACAAAHRLDGVQPGGAAAGRGAPLRPKSRSTPTRSRFGSRPSHPKAALVPSLRFWAGLRGGGGRGGEAGAHRPKSLAGHTLVRFRLGVRQPAGPETSWFGLGWIAATTRYAGRADVALVARARSA